VRNAGRRHLDDLKHGRARGLTFDAAAADRAIRFFETKLKLSEGQFEGKPLLLHPSQAFKVGSIFGWKRADGTRRFRRAYIEEGKGNGKSPIAGGVGLYGMLADNEFGAQIYAAGATKDQAGILFRDAVNMVDKSPDLDKRVKRSGGPGREYNLANLKTNSFFPADQPRGEKDRFGSSPAFRALRRGARAPRPRRDGDAGARLQIPPPAAPVHDHEQRIGSQFDLLGRARTRVKVAAGNRDAKDDDPAYLGEPLTTRRSRSSAVSTPGTTRSTIRAAGRRRTRSSA
jgi:hypothetical protein